MALCAALRVEAGYCVGKAFWGKGYATEAMDAMIHYMIEKIGLNRVQAVHAAGNPASGKVMQKFGMTHEGLLREYNYDGNGKKHDCNIYAILAADLKA